MVKTKKFWCAERVQRLMMSIFLLIILGLLSKGHNTLAAMILISFMSIMLFIYFIFDFCPSTWMLSKLLGSCYCECEGSENENQL